MYLTTKLDAFSDLCDDSLCNGYECVDDEFSDRGYRCNCPELCSCFDHDENCTYGKLS